MKKTLLIIALATSLVTSVNCAYSEQCSCNENKGSISVNTSSQKEITPDTAEITVEVVTTDVKSLNTASLKNKQVSEAVYNKLKSMINIADGDSIKTSNYSANPIYVYNNGKRIFDKYQVSNQIIIKTKSLNSVGSIIDNSMNLGATNINGLNFTASNYDEQCSDILSEATDKAYSQAVAIAQATRTTLSGVKNISANCSMSGNNRNYRMLMSAKGTDAVSAESSTTIEAGTIKIYANVSATYFVK